MLIAFFVALGLTMPAGVRAMQMPAATVGMMAMTVDQPCQHCPQPLPDKTSVCQALGCINAPAVLPSSVLLPGRVLLGAAYANPVAAHLAGAETAPDPFPPRPIVLL